MKAVATASLFLAAILLILSVGGWVELLYRLGPVEGIRVGLTVWPGNALGFVILVLAIVFGICGVNVLNQTGTP